MSHRKEIAKALGFSSIKQMEDHQKWLARQKKMESALIQRVKTSGAIIDVRDILEESIHRTGSRTQF